MKKKDKAAEQKQRKDKNKEIISCIEENIEINNERQRMKSNIQHASI